MSEPIICPRCEALGGLHHNGCELDSRQPAGVLAAFAACFAAGWVFSWSVRKILRRAATVGGGAK